MLGPDYIRIVSDSVRSQIAQRTAADESAYYYSDEEGAFTTIAPDQGFYINARATSWWCSKYESRRGIWESRNSKSLPEASRGGLWFSVARCFCSISFPWY